MSTESKANHREITVTVNEQKTVLPERTTVAELLERRGSRSRSVVWVNDKHLLLAEYSTWALQNGDRVKILRLATGG